MVATVDGYKAVTISWLEMSLKFELSRIDLNIYIKEVYFC